MNIMKTIYVVTTREFPIHNSKFQDVKTGNLVIQKWSKHFKASIKTSWNSDDSLSLKCYKEGGIILYVAPSLIDLSGKKPEDYVNDILNAVVEDISDSKDICDEQYQIFLIAHDADLGTQEIRFKLRANNANDEILNLINPICCGYMTFKHASHSNRQIIGVESKSEYDIFDDFIDWLNADNFADKVCVNLKQQLTNYGLNQE